MTAVQMILLLNSLLDGIEILVPKIAELTKKGEISVQEQSALLSRIASIRDGSAFKGPAWEVE